MASILDMASLLPPKVANIRFDTDGDTLLLLFPVGGSARFQVSSSALCLASPVFRAMLGAKGKFKESKSLQKRKSGDPPVEITLKDDNPDALAVILRIIHYQHDSVPESLSEENLWQIAMLIDKYDLRVATKPWINLWTQPYLSFAGLPLASSSYFTGDRGIFLAYVFGKDILFKNISKSIILTWMSIPGHHRLHPSDFATGSRAGSFEFVPQPVVEDLYYKRKVYVREMLNCIIRYIDLYSGSQGVQCPYKQQSCDSFILGTLIRKLNQQHLSTSPETPISHSMEQVTAILAKIKPPQNVFFGGNRSDCHEQLDLCYCSKTNCKRCIYRIFLKSIGSDLELLRTNHASCFPIEDLKEDVLEIMHKVEGLILANYARNTSGYPPAVWGSLK